MSGFSEGRPGSGFGVPEPDGVRGIVDFAAFREAAAAIAATIREYALILLDSDGGIATWNPGAERITGYGADAAIGQPSCRFYPLEDVAAGVPEQILDRARRDGRVEVSGWRLRKGGFRFWAEIVITPLFGRSGDLLGFTCFTRDITERMLGDDLFRAAMRHSPVGTILTSPDGVILAVNEVTTEILGYGADDLIGLDIETLMHPDDRAISRLNWADVEAGRSPTRQFEKRYTRQDGSTVMVLLTMAAITNDRGQVIYSIRYLQDISSRKAEEAERIRLAERMALAAQAAGIGIWEWNIETNQTHWDDRILALYGAAPGSPEAEDSDFLFRSAHPDDRDRMYKAFWRAIDEGAPFDTEFRAVWPDGSLRHLRTAATIVRDEAGKAIRIVGIHWDITDSKTSEEARAQLADRMMLAANAGGIGVWEVNIKTGERYWSDLALRQYGFEPDTPAPAPSEWMRAVHPDDRETLERLIDEALANFSPCTSEFRVAWCDGSIHHLRALSTAVRDQSGKPLRIVGVNLDVTEQRVLAQRLEEEKERLVETVDKWTIAKQAAEQANRAKSEFLTVMSHELRTPLNAVLGFGQLLTDSRFGPLNPKQADFVQTILDSGGHLLGLIDEILELSTIEAGKMELSIGPVELLPVMKSVIATLTPATEKLRIKLNAGTQGAAAPMVRADRLRLAQALLNLGSNAIKYNRPDGEVTFTYERITGDWLRISVIDTGIGIPEDRRGELFQSFSRLGAAQLAIEGTGVGLALTRRLIDLMGGRVDFTSTPGKGSRFWIDMPIDRTPSEGDTGAANP